MEVVEQVGPVAAEEIRLLYYLKLEMTSFGRHKLMDFHRAAGLPVPILLARL